MDRWEDWTALQELVTNLPRGIVVPFQIRVHGDGDQSLISPASQGRLNGPVVLSLMF